MDLNQFYLTNDGRRLLARVQAGELLTFTKVGLGEGEPISQEFMEQMTGLVRPRDYFPIVEVRDKKDGTVAISAVCDNKNVETRYFIREVGVYAQDPIKGEILFAVCSCGDASDLFSSKSDKELFLTLEIIITIGNATHVTFLINDSLVWATVGQLRELAGDGRTDETVKKNADDILALKLKLMMGGLSGGMGGLDENSILISFKDLKEEETFWGFWDRPKARLVG